MCFQFGIEVDDIVKEEDGTTSYKIEVGANRSVFTISDNFEISFDFHF